jgi:hypothetical protein
MARRTITGTIRQANGAAWRNGLVVFALTKLTYAGGQSVPRTAQGTFSAETDANGQFKITLEAGDTANVRCQYRVMRPNGAVADFLLAPGAPIDLDLLLALQAVTEPSALAQHGATPASATTLGHVKIGAGLEVDEEGTLGLPVAALTEAEADARYQSQADAAGHAATLAATDALGHIQPGPDFLVDSDGFLHHSAAFLDLLQNPPAPGVITEAEIQLSDVPTNNVSAGRHGFTPKLPAENAGDKFLRGDGMWAGLPASMPSGAIPISSPEGVGWGELGLGLGLELSGPTLILSPKLVQHKTANYALTLGERGQVFTNYGAAGTIFLDLPPGAVGLEYRFFVLAPHDLVVRGATNEKITTRGANAEGSVRAFALGEVCHLLWAGLVGWIDIAGGGFVTY